MTSRTLPPPQRPGASLSAAPIATRAVDRGEGAVRGGNNLQSLMAAGVADYIHACDPITAAKNPDNVPEFEVRFGGGPVLGQGRGKDKWEPLTQVDYSAVVREIGKHGYYPNDVRGTMLLRITPQGNEGGAKTRAEIVGETMISAYCRSESLEKVASAIPDAVRVMKFTRKTDPARKIGPVVDGEATRMIHFSDYNFRMAFQYEKNYPITSADPEVREIMGGWAQSRKHYRCMNRTRFQHSDPTQVVAVDVSIVKSNTARGANATTAAAAGIFGNAPETYEIELELDNERVITLLSSRRYSASELTDLVVAQLRTAIRVVLSGLQETMYPVPFPEQSAILREYMSCLHGAQWDNPAAPIAPYFAGPSSVTLQLSHVASTTAPSDLGLDPAQESTLGGGERADTQPPDAQPLSGTDITGGARKPNPVHARLRPARPTQVPVDKVSILSDYCVTEKADGNRALLYISATGRVYMINSNLKVIFTGTRVTDKDCFRVILDGEYIERSQDSAYLNLYAAFDVYYVHHMHPHEAKVDIRSFPFCKAYYDADEGHKFRLPILEKIVGMINLEYTVAGTHPRPPQHHAAASTAPNCLLTVKAKRFFVGGGIGDSESAVEGEGEEGEAEEAVGAPDALPSIFVQAGKIWNHRHAFNYEIDGLIFTPTNLGVGDEVPGKHTMLAKKYVWQRSFKWKPAEFNTIDFLVQTVKDNAGRDKVFNRFIGDDIVQYKRLVLHCGHNTKTDNYANPVHSMLHDTNAHRDADNTNVIDEAAVSTLVAAVYAANNKPGYYPVPFVPSVPYDNQAKYCNVAIDASDKLMRATDGDVFAENMIVEFKYLLTSPGVSGAGAGGAGGAGGGDADPAWNWVPIRVRYDKTGRLRAGKAEFGNSYMTANSNWKSIHFPVTTDIIRGAETSTTGAEQLYYNRGAATESHTIALRKFHNEYIKRRIINQVAAFFGTPRVNIDARRVVPNANKLTLIDFAVGKAGDLYKWKDANVHFVLGVDVVKDNILNPDDGAVARYHNMRNTTSSSLRAVFLHGDSGLNIRTEGTAFNTDQDRQVARALFGEGSSDRDRAQVAPAFYRVGAEGFKIGSIQFAAHYFFESPRKLHALLRNLAECIAKNGVFVGTCFNGERVFALLRDKRKGESVTIYSDPAANKQRVKLFEVVKKYSADVFPDDETSVGMPITVFQESINQAMDEYLVNFTFFERLLSEYGFEPVNAAECAAMGIPQSRVSFGQVYNDAHRKQTRGTAMVPVLSAGELRISSLNDYFVYKKVRIVDPAALKALHARYVGKETVVAKRAYSKQLARDNYVNYALRIPDKFVTVSSKTLYV